MVNTGDDSSLLIGDFFTYISCFTSSTNDLTAFIVGAVAVCDGFLEKLPNSDVDLLEFPLSLEYLEAEFFSWWWCAVSALCSGAVAIFRVLW
ncbi:Hypothetical predicted protein [Olea europaea subsp. europaea]|uniref:Uncharacterized protein n=1 Tax=Olea europaea subsp. europaea TaxID=158383 RepID=A0A8S0Q0I4_OLEEU|nr:Hypothetical predicted protein [Olea europaea subsp. europaea]